MKIRRSLLCFFLGVSLTTTVSIFALYGKDIHWQTEAFKHYAAAYKVDLKTGKIRWMWLDDYFVEQLQNYHATPSPQPARL